jgi:putative nucleotidyltransferase with HDIG domain
VVHVFKSNPLLDETGISPEALQHHSLFVGSAAQALGKYEKMDQKSADHLFAAGILHDVGKLVLASSRHQQYAEIMRRFMAGEGELVHLEREVLGAGHAEVGAYLLGLWGFPDPVIEAVAFHHEVSKYLGPGFDAVTAVHVANALDNITRSDHSPCRRSRIDMDYIEHLGMLEKLEAWRLVVAEVGGNAVAENPPEGHKHD